jgi:hypothetical protein
MANINRWNVINAIASHRRYRTYLEIGVCNGSNFKNVQFDLKHGVDPNVDTTFRMTSDEFFSSNDRSYDLVFIDGYHTRNQAFRDISGALNCLTPGGTVIVHDCLPLEERHQGPSPYEPGRPWTGDVWKAVVELRSRDDLEISVLDCDWGLGIIRFGSSVPFLLEEGLTWNLYERRRDEILNVVPASSLADLL